MAKYVMEFTGTFFLVLVIALTGNPIAIGSVIPALLYMGYYISGGNYNPAVTLALFINKKLDAETAKKYVLSQILGGLTAAGVYLLIAQNYFIPAPSGENSIIAAITVEILFTFLLATVVLHVAASPKTRGNDYYGLAIGFTVLAIAQAGGPVSGGVFNPAVALGPIIFNFSQISSNFQNLLLYLVCPLAGGILAGFLYKKIK